MVYAQTPKTILIIIDGIPSDLIESVSTPGIDAVAGEGAGPGVVASGPIFTGVRLASVGLYVTNIATESGGTLTREFTEFTLDTGSTILAGVRVTPFRFLVAECAGKSIQTHTGECLAIRLTACHILAGVRIAWVDFGLT